MPEDPRLKKLDKLLGVFDDDAVRVPTFNKAMDKLSDLVVKRDEDLADDIEDVADDVSTVEGNLSALQTNFQRHTTANKKSFRQVRNRVGTLEADVSELQQIEIPEINEREVAVNAINLLENFSGDDRLDGSAIKNLEDNIDTAKLDFETLDEGEIQIDASQVNGINDLLPDEPPQYAGGSGASFLHSMRDVDRKAVKGPSDGQVLKYDSNSGKWTAGSGGGSGSSVAVDLSNNSTDEITDLTRINTANDTNSIITNNTGDEILFDLSNNYPTADNIDNGTLSTSGSTLTSTGGVDVTLGGTAGDDLNVDSGGMVYESDTGHVGIGTDSPGSLAHIEGGSGVTNLTIGNTRTDLTDSEEANAIQFEAGPQNPIAKIGAFVEGKNENLGGLEFYGYDSGYQSLLQLTRDADAKFFGNIRAIDGSASQTAIGFSGDSNTGLYHPADDELGAVTGGTERMRIDSSGNVGIGTNNPETELQVNLNNSATDRQFMVNQQGTGNAAMSFRIDGASEFAIGIDNDDNDKLKIDSSSGVSQDTEFTLQQNGNVGIGTSSPDTLLNIKGSSSKDGGDPVTARIGDESTGSDFTVGAETHSLQFYSDDSSNVGGVKSKISQIAEDTALANVGLGFYTSGNSLSEQMRIDSSGNVGIGTTSPNENLHIEGGEAGVGIKLNNTGTNGGSYNIYASNDNQFAGGNKLFFGTSPQSSDIRMTLDSSGNVGIGTSSPDRALNVKGSGVFGSGDHNSGRQARGLAIRDTGDNAALNLMHTGSGGREYEIFSVGDDSSNNPLGPAGNFTVYDQTAGSARIAIDKNGNVGIGTSSPDAQLHNTGTSQLDGNITLGMASQDYLLRDRNNDELLALQSQSSGSNSELGIFTRDGDGTDSAFLYTWSEGTPGSISDRSRLGFGFSSARNQYELAVKTNGSGSNQPINIYTDGNEDQIFADTNGNVGIGTSSPTEKLHIAGDSNPTIQIDDTQGGAFPTLNFAENNTVVSQVVQDNNADRLEFRAGGNDLVHLQESGDIELQPDGAGNVGIGTDSPNNALHIQDSVNGGIFTIQQNNSTGNSANMIWEASDGSDRYTAEFTPQGDPTNDTLTWDTSDTSDVFTIEGSGNVGIGTSSPDSKLHNSGAYTQEPLSSDPTDPDAGHSVQWVSDGTGSGDQGDVMMKINVGGTVKTVTVVDYSAA